MENFPRVAAHKQRTDNENQITRKAVIQNLIKSLQRAEANVKQAYEHLNRVELKHQDEIRALKSKVQAYQSTAWFIRARILMQELFGRKTEIL